MERAIHQEQVKQELEKGYSKAEVLIKDKDKMDKVLESLEKKLKKIPKVGKKLSHVPVFIQLVKCYVKKEYTDIPMGSVLAIVSALLYVLSPIDLIPDVFPGIGYVDDAAVVAFCLLMVGDDVKEFLVWRDGNKVN